MYIKRTAEKMILEVSKSFPCIVVYGPRQVGKSTTIDILFGEKYRKVTLDDTDDRALALSNPKLFLESYGWPLIIDEIQKAPVLLDEIKAIIDKQRLVWMKSGEKRQLMFILTGSNRFEPQESISDSLAGRCGLIDMASFSQAEKYGYKNPLFSPDLSEIRKRETSGRRYRTRKEIYEDIFIGGMPDICTGESERDAYFKSYLNTYIEKDVLKLISASSEMQFRNFLSIAALRTAQELHYDEIAANVGIDVRTCKRWISILQTSGIIYLLQPYMANISNRIIKAPKLYFTDTGLCAYLCKWPNAEMLENCAMNGAFFETFVVSEVVKNFYAYNKDPSKNLFHYRDIDRKEIDLLFVEGDIIYPIEIKKGTSPTKPTKNFDVLEKYKLRIMPGLVIDTCDRIRAINEKAYTFPVYLL
ncbi:MAG: ATP-binding protein [Candidatus Methanomethylophilaceae archaeon]|nr:ATP-binding protein [Candidatus Methanomethylophilaceae archaeon]